ncbi:MAG: AAA family ATPase [Planctomycetaceae bacterium]
MLRSLELFGFKSFADRIRFDFHPGITGVVGPNGSGKSNVVDAVKWILGVQSAKSLRGNSMTDVIFNGAAGRKPSAMAEATLTFDNSSGFLRVDAAEVQIGRRIMQGGDAEYFINRAPARLKDIVKLLLGTGAGGNAYCIIEQGRVDQILQANASARRKVFEEAAGISRYKTDKVEAERKLARVDQNLLRLSDIVEEARSRLDSLRGQATKAARFRDVTDRFREAWLGLAADDHRRLSAQLARFDEVLAERTEHIAERTARQRELETQLAAMDGEVSEVDDRLRDAERRAAANHEAIAGRQVATRHESERAADLDAEIQRLRKQLALMNSRSGEIAAEHARVHDQLRRFAEEHSHLAEKRARREERIAALAAEVERGRTRLADDRQRLLDRTRNASALGSRVETCESQAADRRQEREAIRRRQAALDSKRADRAGEVERRRAALAETARIAAAAEDVLQGVRDRRAAVGGELDDAQRGLAQHREQRTGWQARLAVLEDLESRKEGFGIGVREILSRAETSDYPPWNHVRGSVADLLEVDLEQAPLIEVALGHRAQLIVLDRIQPLLDYLQSESCRISGRVGFVPYGSDELRVTSDELSDRRGVIARADRLVRSPDELPRLGEQLLSDTWIVDTLATAVALRAEIRGRRTGFSPSATLDQRSEVAVRRRGSLDSRPSTLDPRLSTPALRHSSGRIARARRHALRRDHSLRGGARFAQERTAAAEERHRPPRSPHRRGGTAARSGRELARPSR